MWHHQDRSARHYFSDSFDYELFSLVLHLALLWIMQSVFFFFFFVFNEDMECDILQCAFKSVFFQNQVLIIAGDTGCGKSTQVCPSLCMNFKVQVRAKERGSRTSFIYSIITITWIEVEHEIGLVFDFSQRFIIESLMSKWCRLYEWILRIVFSLYSMDFLYLADHWTSPAFLWSSAAVKRPLSYRRMSQKLTYDLKLANFKSNILHLFYIW